MAHEHVESMLKVEEVFQPSKDVVEKAWVKDYEKVYKHAVENPEVFWGDIAKELEWFEPWKKVLKWEHPWASWFVGAKCNITYNCLDRHVKTWRRNKAAIIWVGEDGSERVITYNELLREVNKAANVLASLGVRKGDRVTIYLPRIPEQVIAMLACARIGAIHSLVYSGFSAAALQSRIHDAEAKVVITADCGYQRAKCIPLKHIVDDAVKDCPSVEKVIVVRRADPKIELNPPLPPFEKRGGKGGFILTGTKRWKRHLQSLKLFKWMLKTRCLHSTHQEQPVNPRVSFMFTAVIWWGHT